MVSRPYAKNLVWAMIITYTKKMMGKIINHTPRMGQIALHVNIFIW